MADGSIRVNTTLDTKPAKADLKKLEQECEKTARKIEKVGEKVKTAFTGGNGMEKLGQDCENAAAKIGEVGKTAQAVFTGMSKSQLESAFKKANKELLKTEEQLAAVDTKIAEVQAETDRMLPGATTASQTKNLLEMEEAQIAPLTSQRDQLTAKAAEYRRQMEGITAEINKQTQAEAAQKALKTTGKQAAADAEWVAKINSQKQYDAALTSIRAKMSAIEHQAARIAQETGRPVSGLLQQDAEYQKLSRRLSLLTSQTREFGTAGKNAAKKTKVEMSSADKTMQKFGNTLKRGIKKVGKMALAVLGIRAAFMAVRRATTAYLESNKELSNQMTALWNVAGQAIGPVVELIIKAVSTAVNWINSLVKALTGVDLVAKANAAALAKQANATVDAANAARQLAGFDEMNKLTDNSSSAGSTGGTTTGTFDANIAFDIPGFLEKIKGQILAGDWYGVGKTLGESLMNAIEEIDWKTLGTNIGNAIVNAAQVALGFILSIDPLTILKKSATFFSGFMDGISKKLQEMDWQEVGSDIIDFLEKGALAALILSNPLVTIIAAMFSPEGTDFTNSFAELAGTVMGALAGALVGAVTGIAEKIKETWTKIKNYFSEYVDWEGTPGDIIKGLWNGIIDALKTAGTWIYNNIWVPFRDGFKKAFGINSPSTKMAEFGGYLIDGLKNGIGNVWNSIKEKFTAFKDSVKSWFDDRKTNFKDWGTGLITNLKNGIGNIWNSIKEKFTNAKDKLVDWATTLKEKGKNAGTKFIDGLKNGFNDLKTKLKEPINALIGMIEKAINWIIEKMNKLSWKVPDWVPAIGGKTFGFNLQKVSIPRLAKGGIVNNPGRGVLATVGEAGAEAVLPLENNTEWMDILADKINAVGQKIVVPIYLNGRKIAEEVIDLTQKRNFATNGGAI